MSMSYCNPYISLLSPQTHSSNEVAAWSQSKNKTHTVPIQWEKLIFVRSSTPLHLIPSFLISVIC